MNTPDYAAAVLASAEAGASTTLSWPPCAGACGSWLIPRPGSCRVRFCSRSRTCHAWTSCPSRHLTGPVTCSTGWWSSS